MKTESKKRSVMVWIAVAVGCWIVGGVALGILAIQAAKEQGGRGTFITSTNFGLVQPDNSIVAAARVPRRVGVSYGWSLYVYPAGDVTRIREVFVLAEGGKFGEIGPPKSSELKVVERTISADGREKTEVFEVRSRRAFTIRQDYTVADDDPAGHYEIKLYVDETDVARFGFEIVDEQKIQN